MQQQWARQRMARPRRHLYHERLTEHLFELYLAQATNWFLERSKDLRVMVVIEGPCESDSQFSV